MEFAISGLALIVSVVLGVWSLRVAHRSTEAAKRSADAAEASTAVTRDQLRATVDANVAAVQPYVWADIRGRGDGQLIVLVVGNSGPTVASDVRLSFVPPLKSIAPVGNQGYIGIVEERLGSGLPSLAPGRTHIWNLGSGQEVLRDVPDVEVTISAVGPAGEMSPLVYRIGLDVLGHQSSTPLGVDAVGPALREINTTLKGALKV
jgi:hypothetical protein